MILPSMIAIHEDESEAVDLSDPFRPTGPYGIAKACEEKIAALELQRELMPRSERKLINEELHRLCSLMSWCKTRTGYVEPEVDA